MPKKKRKSKLPKQRNPHVEVAIKKHGGYMRDKRKRRAKEKEKKIDDA